MSAAGFRCWLVFVLVVVFAPATVLAQATVEKGRSEAAKGQKVRVTVADGSRRTAVFVSLSDSALVIRDTGGDVTMPLSSVRRVERVSHEVRSGALVGLGGGFILGMILCAPGDESSCGPEVIYSGLIGGGIGAGIGAALGAVMKGRHADRRILYQSAAPAATVAIAPVAGRRRIGVMVRVGW